MPDKEEAAHDQVAEGRLLPGEDPGATHPDDALHWTEVYGELLDFKNRTIERVRDDLSRLGEAARREVETTDLVVLAAERDRFRRRIEYWRERHRELSG